MKARGSKTPALASKLLELRGKRSLQTIVNRLENLGLKTHKGTIQRYEESRSPDVGILYGLSLVYDVSFNALCELAIADLFGHAPAVEVTVPPTPEALRIAWSFDRGSEHFRQALRSLLELAEGTGNTPGLPARPDDVQEAPTVGTHERAQRSRKTR